MSTYHEKEVKIILETEVGQGFANSKYVLKVGADTLMESASLEDIFKYAPDADNAYDLTKNNSWHHDN